MKKSEAPHVINSITQKNISELAKKIKENENRDGDFDTWLGYILADVISQSTQITYDILTDFNLIQFEDE